MRIIIVAVVLVFICGFACEQDEKKAQLVKQVIESPESIELHLEMSQFNYNHIKLKYFPDSASKQLYVSRLAAGIKRHIGRDFSIYCNRQINDYDRDSNRYERIHEIAVSGIDPEYTLMFKWLFQDTKWVVYDIYLTGKVYCN